MKLISRTILYFVFISLPLLVIAGFISYTVIKSDVKEGTDESLWMEKLNTLKLIRSFKEPHNVIISYDSLSKITYVNTKPKGFSFSDTMIFEKEENEKVNYRILRSYTEANGHTYLVTLAKPTFEEDELIKGLVSSLLIVTGFLILSFFIVNWILSKWLWKPFYKTIETLDGYDLKNNPRVHFSSSSIKEFDKLNEALDKMTGKIYTDFTFQKEFTENAAHEMQTPLAVMKAKLDLLIQSPNLREEEMNQLQAMDNSVSKLAALNKALLLLAKIENNQFKDIAEMSLQKTLERVLGNYESMIESKELSVIKTIRNDHVINMNPVLCEILISNLLQNAIRHNTQKGNIKIELQDNSLSISNNGNPLQIDPREMFVRFKKNNASQESLGLGLSIVKSIVDAYSLQINYSYSDSMHTFTVIF
ncbi:MAG TPA: HAMP domain-containing sensor histidine kinase [Bacteroidia bacterium]|jgi:signal transduction histidine kinase|nr:HAMP domain-containing sensor histidine kinase [Bacteroidia bacterium]